jgi:hypothetical protein
MVALGAETFQGQHRGTGSGLQATFNRLASIVVSLLCSSPLVFILILIDDGELIDFLGIDYCVIRESEDGNSCLYRGRFVDYWRNVCVVVAL